MPPTLFLSPTFPPSNASHSLPNPTLIRFPNNPSSFSPKASQNPNFSILGNPFPLANLVNSLPQTDGGVKVPTPPWMIGPLLIPPEEVLDLSKKGKKSRSDGSDGHDRSLTQGVRGGRGRQAMKKIVESITRLQRIGGVDVEEEEDRKVSEFRVLLGGEEEEEEGTRRRLGGGGRMPWVGSERIVFRREKKVRVATAAERSLPEVELMRLRGEARKIRRWVKVKKAGVTEEKVEEIRIGWRESELVMVKFDLPLCRNMERAMEIVEVRQRRPFFFLEI